MSILSMVVVIAGLCLFEAISSIDNAIVNAEVLSTMKQRARKWFLTWGIFFAVFVVRGLLPWLIVWLVTPGIGPIEAFTATLTSDPKVIDAIEHSAPILLIGGGTFLCFLFFHWLFVEDKEYGLIGERFLHSQSVWFYAIVSVLLTALVWFSIRQDPLMAIGAVIGSTAFFIIHGFRQNAERLEQSLTHQSHLSDISKLCYLEVLDVTFSIDGVLGAFAFTLAVPLILIGNGLGALVVRSFTISHVHTIKRYLYLKNGAMYSIFFLSIIMLLEAFGAHIPVWLSPLVTFGVVLYFYIKSRKHPHFHKKSFSTGNAA